MARKAKIVNEHKKNKLEEKYRKQRRQLREKIGHPDTSDEERFEALMKLQKLPRNSCPTRLRNRCHLTGRSRGYLRAFGLSRIAFRELALRGMIPGVTKSSW